MKRTMLYALTLFVALLYGSAGAIAGEAVIADQLAAKATCKKKANGKCVKPAGEQGKKKKTKKKKPKPLAPVKPTIEKGYRPPFFTTSPRTQLSVAAYKACMYAEGDTESVRVERALSLNFSYRRTPGFSGGPEKIGREICFADALGLKRYFTQEEIDGAKGTELVEVSTQFIDLANDEGNRFPPERRFARPWVKEYLEAFARDLHDHLLSKKPHGSIADIPRLRVTSLVRALADQEEQHSPAKCKTEICSTHLTGSTVDIANGGRVSEEARKWIRARLFKDRNEGKILVIQEFARPHYHIFVVPTEFVPSLPEE